MFAGFGIALGIVFTICLIVLVLAAVVDELKDMPRLPLMAAISLLFAVAFWSLAWPVNP
jgi:hypothetical protein